MSIESMMPSNHLVLCHPLLLLASIFPSIRVFTNQLALGIRWPKYWNFSFSISPSSEYSGLISFRIYWFDLFAVQGTLKHLQNILHYIPVIYLHISPLQQCFSSIALFIFEFQAIKMYLIHKSPLNVWWLNYSVLKSILYVKHLQNKTLNI